MINTRNRFEHFGPSATGLKAIPPSKVKKVNTRNYRSIVLTLRDREIDVNFALFSNLKIARQMIRSDKALYNEYTKIDSPRGILRNKGIIFFFLYNKYCSIYSLGSKPSLFSPIENNVTENNRRMQITDSIFYTGKYMYKNIDNIYECESEQNMIPCLLSAGPTFIYQHSLRNGKIIKEIHVNNYQPIFQVMRLEWDTYGERFSCVSELYHRIQAGDIKAWLAIFTTFPIEFFAKIEIKSSVFGENVKCVRLFNQCLAVCLDSDDRRYITVYNFDHFIKGGTLTPYKLGDAYGDGTVGTFPMGLPSNFAYDEAPPQLFKVECSEILGIRFSRYQYHYITMYSMPGMGIVYYKVGVHAVNTGNPIKADKSLLINQSEYLYDPQDAVVFHPDNSNRIIVRDNFSIVFYRILAEEDKPSIQFTLTASEKLLGSKHCLCDSTLHQNELPPYWVLGFHYEQELNIIAVLYRHTNCYTGYLCLYSNVTGEFYRAIKLKERLNGTSYKLFMDLQAITIIEKQIQGTYCIHIYRIESLKKHSGEN